MGVARALAVLASLPTPDLCLCKLHNKTASKEPEEHVVSAQCKLHGEMINEVEVYETETPASEELYSKLELKVRKKFNDEIDRLEKSFRRIMEQLEI